MLGFERVHGLRSPRLEFGVGGVWRDEGLIILSLSIHSSLVEGVRLQHPATSPTFWMCSSFRVHETGVFLGEPNLQFLVS